MALHEQHAVFGALQNERASRNELHQAELEGLASSGAAAIQQDEGLRCTEPPPLHMGGRVLRALARVNHNAEYALIPCSWPTLSCAFASPAWPPGTSRLRGGGGTPSSATGTSMHASSLHHSSHLIQRMSAGNSCELRSQTRRHSGPSMVSYNRPSGRAVANAYHAVDRSLGSMKLNPSA